MQVREALTGEIHYISVTEDVDLLISDVSNQLANFTRREDQVFLDESGEGLELSSKKVLDHESVLFLYDRRYLSSDAAAPPLPEPPAIAVDVQVYKPPKKEPIPKTPEDISFLTVNRLRHYRTCVQNVREAHEQRVSFCKAAYARACIQAEGVRVACLNLQHHHKRMQSSISSMERHCGGPIKTIVQSKTEFISNFDQLCAKLKTVILPSPLATTLNAKTLLDCLPQPVINNQVMRCRDLLAQIERDSEDILSQRSTASITEAVGRCELDGQSLCDISNEESSELRSCNIANDIEEFLRIVAADMQKASSLTSLVGDQFQEVSEMGRKTTLEKRHAELGDVDARSCQMLSWFTEKQIEITNRAQKLLSRVVHLEKQMRDVLKKQVEPLGLAITHLETSFGALFQLGGLEEAYRAFVVEIHRRRKAWQHIDSGLKDLTAGVGSMRQQEIQSRDLFWEKYGSSLPQSLASLVQDRVPLIEVYAPPYDALLPDLGSIPAEIAAFSVETTPHVNDQEALLKEKDDLEARIRELELKLQDALKRAQAQTPAPSAESPSQERDQFQQRISELEKALQESLQTKETEMSRLKQQLLVAQQQQAPPSALGEDERQQLQQHIKELTAALGKGYQQAAVSFAATQAVTKAIKEAAVADVALSSFSNQSSDTLIMQEREREADNLRDQVNSLNERILEYQEDLKACQTDLETCQSQLDACQSELKACQGRLREATEACQKQLREAGENSANMERRLSKKEIEWKQQKERTTLLESKLAAKENEAMRLKETVGLLEARVKEAESDHVSALQLQMHGIIEGVNNIVGVLATAETGLGSLHQQLDDSFHSAMSHSGSNVPALSPNSLVEHGYTQATRIRDLVFTLQSELSSEVQAHRAGSSIRFSGEMASGMLVLFYAVIPSQIETSPWKAYWRNTDVQYVVPFDLRQQLLASGSDVPFRICKIVLVPSEVSVASQGNAFGLAIGDQYCEVIAEVS